ncbi:MAG TPA: hypothetical protein EYQ50_29915 [Verrucomicrobiales bacterium]|nr:hypothetical protein [Verrucomicrobiales bacterium]HIL69274.1 hypothetical protein [Verrucomicrobiota bacterium]
MNKLCSLYSFQWLSAGMLFLGSLSLLAEEKQTFKVSEFTFELPAVWKKEKPSSSMRAAQLSAPGKSASDSAEVTFFYFGARSGSVNANVERWIKQFQNSTDTKKTTKEINGIKITYVQTDGTFMSGPPFGKKIAKKNYGLMAGILEGKSGNVFVKMTGPKETTVSVTPAFKKMVEGAAKR